MRKPKICGYDLNGFKDRVAKNWQYTDQGEEIIGDAILSGEVIAPDIVSVGVGKRRKWIGGNQALLAPHGRGGGWGAVGGIERRVSVQEILHNSDAEREQLSAAMAGHAAGARFCAVSIEDDHVISKPLKERLFAAISKAKLGRTIIVWRSALVVLGFLANKSETFVPTDKMSLGVITHNAKGIIVQRFELRTIENSKGTFFIPERKQGPLAASTGFGYDLLIELAQNELSSNIAQNLGVDTALRHAIFDLALCGNLAATLCRNSRGKFNMVPEKALTLPTMKEDFEEVSTILKDCELVLFETLTSGAIKSSIKKSLEAVLDHDLTATADGIVAIGALEAARRVSEGNPIYLDDLPAINGL